MADTTGAGRESWSALRDRRMAESGAEEAYEAARLAFELGAAVRELRLARGWSQAELASAAGMTQSAVARFEAGGHGADVAGAGADRAGVGCRPDRAGSPPSPDVG